MRVIVDTNVLTSGAFFGGIPGRILSAWRVIVSGDKDLVDRSGWRGIRGLRPRQFANEFLGEQ